MGTNLSIHRKRKHPDAPKQDFFGPNFDIPRDDLRARERRESGEKSETTKKRRESGEKCESRNGTPLPTRRKKVFACKECENCLKSDCRKCIYCTDKKIYGGNGK